MRARHCASSYNEGFHSLPRMPAGPPVGPNAPLTIEQIWWRSNSYGGAKRSAKALLEWSGPSGGESIVLNASTLSALGRTVAVDALLRPSSAAIDQRIDTAIAHGAARCFSEGSDCTSVRALWAAGRPITSSRVAVAAPSRLALKDALAHSIIPRDNLARAIVPRVLFDPSVNHGSSSAAAKRKRDERRFKKTTKKMPCCTSGSDGQMAPPCEHPLPATAALEASTRQCEALERQLAELQELQEQQRREAQEREVTILQDLAAARQRLSALLERRQFTSKRSRAPEPCGFRVLPEGNLAISSRDLAQPRDEIAVGTPVAAQFGDDEDELWFPAVVTSVHTAKYDVQYDDGDLEFCKPAQRVCEIPLSRAIDHC